MQESKAAQAPEEPKAKSKADDFFAMMKSGSSQKPATAPKAAVGGGLAAIMSGLVSAKPKASQGDSSSRFVSHTLPLSSRKGRVTSLIATTCVRSTLAGMQQTSMSKEGVFRREKAV